MCLLYFVSLCLGLIASAEDRSRWLPERSVCFEYCDFGKCNYELLQIYFSQNTTNLLTIINVTTCFDS
jgi:hypothetical protein